MPRGPQPSPITLTDNERDKLNAWVCRPTTPQRLALRARIVLAAAAGQSNTAVAEDLRITLPTVRKWRSRFAISRLDGLTDEPRPGATRTITDAQVKQALARTLETKPRKPSSCPPTPSSPRRCGILSDFTWPHPKRPSFCASTRRVRCRPWTGPSRFSLCSWAGPKKLVTTTFATAPRPCSAPRRGHGRGRREVLPTSLAPGVRCLSGPRRRHVPA